MRTKLDKLANDFIQAISPDDDVRAVASAKGLVRADGTVPPERVPVRFPWQSRDFVLPGMVVNGANRGGIFSFPQGGVARRLSARCRTAPVGGSAVFALTVNGVSVGNSLRVSIPAGEFASDANADYEIPAMGNVALIVVASNGVADVTITVHTEPRSETNG